MRSTTPLLAATALAGLGLAQTAGGAGASPDRGGRARSISPSAPPRVFQPLGSFLTNTVTNRPFA